MSLEEIGGWYDFGSEDLADVPDLTVLLDNTEAKLRLEALGVKVGQTSGKPYLLAELSIPSVPEAKSIRHIMMMPTSEDEPKKLQSRQRAIKYFNQAFGIPTTGKVDFDKYLGREAYAILGVEQDQQYGDKNRVKRWVTGV